jgi:citrate synthase
VAIARRGAYRAMGIPTEMFTVMFALGRMPGWIAQWKEMRNDAETRIARPRQIYTGATLRSYTPLDQRAPATAPAVLEDRELVLV